MIIPATILLEMQQPQSSKDTYGIFPNNWLARLFLTLALMFIQKPPWLRILNVLKRKSHQRELKTKHSTWKSHWNHVTSRTSHLFDLLINNRAEKAQVFHSMPPSLWQMGPIYIQFRETARQIKVVNYYAERGVALIQTFNSYTKKN